MDAVRRLEALGLADAQFSKRAVPVCIIAQQLTMALGRADASGEMRELTAAWLAALDREFPGLQGGDSVAAAPVVTGASVTLTAEDRRGAAAPGRAEFPPDRTGADPLPDRATLLGRLEASAQILPRLSVVGGIEMDIDGLEGTRFEAATGFGGVGLTLGRGPIGYGYSRGGAVVLSDVAPVDRFEATTIRPFTLPGVAGRLGGVTITSFFARIHDDRHPDAPFLWGGSGSIRPHPRFTLAVHRAAMFGGDDENYPITAERVLSMLIGRVAGVGFENQVVSVEGILRLPTEGVLPLTAYMEWGAEDAAGAWWDVPARIVGLYSPAIPGFPVLSGGFEMASYAESCCGNPEWYRHWSFPGSWALGESPLGHPLGGNGREWRGYLDVQDPRRGVDVEGAAFRRWRGPENLFVPGREGVSWGGEASLKWRLPAGREIFGSVRSERGAEWRESGFMVGGRLLLP